MPRTARTHLISGALVLTLVATTGHADVTPLGEFTTTVPIEVPVFRGLAPTVQLVATSRDVDGVVGVGWQLDAGGVIARTGPSGGVPGATPSTGDMFWLDGEPLIPCAADSSSPSCTTAVNTRGSSAGFYSTRRESFQRIEHQGTAWVVSHTDGSSGRYESLDGGATWLLARTEDTHGNGIDYSWTCPADQDCRLTSIHYGDNGGAVGAHIQFYYQTRPDIRNHGVAGKIIGQSQRLRSISVEVDDQLARAYELVYTTSPISGRSVLASVEQYGRDAYVDKWSSPGAITAGPTPPLPATTFTVQAQSASAGWRFGPAVNGSGLFTPPTATPGATPRHYVATQLKIKAGKFYDSVADEWIRLPYQSVVGDFDGDGRADVGIGAVVTKCAKVGIHAALTRKGGYVGATNALTAQPGNTTDCWPRFWTADVDGDHRDDVIYKFRGKLWSARSTGTSFVLFPSAVSWSLNTDHCMVGDVDGDSRDDFVCLTDQLLTTARSNGDGTWAISSFNPGAFSVNGPWALGDVNADGFTDVVFAPPDGANRKLIVERSLGDGTYATETQATSYAWQNGDQLSAADVDGDGLTDVVLTRTGGSGFVARSFAGAGSVRFEPSALYTTWANPRIGDVDGDGIADLVHPYDFQVSIGDGMGGFAAPVTAFGTTTCEGSAIVDTDGDGRTDLLCIKPPPTPDPLTPLVVDDYSSTRPARDVYRWMSGDLDGDGRGDYVYVAAHNPGIDVVSVLTSGTPRRVAWSLAPTGAVPGLDDSSALHWRLVDVGGPAGRADGKDDLVMVDHNGTTLRVYTLLGNGDGTFAAVYDRPWKNAAGTVITYSASDLGNFWPLDVDRDGDADLIHLRADTTGVRVELLRATGNGHWVGSSTPYFAGAAPGFADPTDFQPMEVNGDGLLDLVHVQSGVGMTGTVIRSLISRGDGSFAEKSDTRSAAWLDIGRWQPIDLNGDGLTDLAHVRSATTGTSSSLQLDELYSLGDGTFQPSLYASATLFTTDPELNRALEATSTLYPSDLNGDGLTDLLHVSRYRDAGGQRHTALVQLINPGSSNSFGTWIVPAPTKVSSSTIPAGTPWAWRGFRDPSRPDSAGFVAFDANGAWSAVYEIASDRLSRVDNGTGGTTDIAYAALVGNRTYLPAGMLPIVVTSVTRSDAAYAPASTETTTYTFTGATWSDAQQRLLGFGYSSTKDPKQKVLTRYATDEACAGAPLEYYTLDAVYLEMYAHTVNTLVSPGPGPFTCMVQQQSQYECAGVECRLQTDRQMTYDAYGNVVTLTETVTDSPGRQVFTPVVANEYMYLVSLPTYRMVVSDSGSVMSLDTFTYDGNADPWAGPAANGELTRIDHWDGTQYLSSTLEYDAHGQLVRATDPTGGWRDTTYDGIYDAFPMLSCDAIGCTMTVWDTVIGQAAVTWDLNGLATSFAYDAHGRAAQVTRPDGSVTRTQVLDLGRVTGPQAQRQRTRTELSDGSADGVLWTEQFLDGMGRVYRIKHEGGATQTTTFEGMSNRPTRVSETFSGSAPQRFTDLRYDAIGRLVQRTAADGTTRWWIYGLDTVATTDELGRVRRMQHDGAGNVIKVSEYVDNVSVDTTYGYDAMHRMIGSTDGAGLVTSYYYDLLGHLIAERDPDRGLRGYTYRADGKLLSQIDAKGQRIDFTYDATGRPVTREDRAANGSVQRTVSWTYDAIPNQGPAGYSIGHVVRIDDSQPYTQLSSQFMYDEAGRVQVDRRCIDGSCYGVWLSYDAAGRLAQLIYPDVGSGAETVDYHYDDAGRLVRVGPYVTSISYELDGRMKRMDYGNGVTTEYTYDPARRWTTSLTIAKSSTQIYVAGYTHDVTGRITNLAETAPTNIDTMAYTFDELGRLRQVDTSDPQLDRDFVYDSIGRITYSSELGDYHYADPAHPHAMTSADLGAQRGYDANGNAFAIVDPGGRALKLEWTVDDRPAVIYDANGVGTGFAYDVDGRRVKEDGPSGSRRYYNDYFASEDGTLVKYYYAGDHLIARNDGTVAYYHQDHTHSTRVETNASGQVENSYQYDVTGVPVEEHEMFDDNVGFGGVYGNEELGLVYLNARYYDPTSARFISADSVVRDRFAPQSMDRYAYVENDPVNHWDPSGHMKRLVELRMVGNQELRTTWGAFMETGLGPSSGNSHLYDSFDEFMDAFMDASARNPVTVKIDPAVSAILGWFNSDSGGGGSRGAGVVRGFVNQLVINDIGAGGGAGGGGGGDGHDGNSGAEGGGADHEPSISVLDVIEEIIDIGLAVPHDVFVFGGAERDAHIPLFWKLHVGKSLEVLQIFGHSDTEGAYTETVEAAGLSLEVRTPGGEPICYGGAYGANADVEWASREGAPHQAKTGILLEAGIGNAYGGAYSFDGDVRETGFYVGGRFGPWFAGGGMSLETAMWNSRFLMALYARYGGK